MGAIKDYREKVCGIRAELSRESDALKEKLLELIPPSMEMWKVSKGLSVVSDIVNNGKAIREYDESELIDLYDLESSENFCCQMYVLGSKWVLLVKISVVFNEESSFIKATFTAI